MKTSIYNIIIIPLSLCSMFLNTEGINTQKINMGTDCHKKFFKTTDTTFNYAETIKTIAAEIEALKSLYPQLIDFDSGKDVDVENLVINYSYKTHDPEPIAGWRGGVPEPDDDGIWLYINFHDADSQSQIDTQPLLPYNLCIGDKPVTFLLLEGRKTESIFNYLITILKRHAVVDC